MSALGDRLAELCLSHSISMVYAYGSRAREALEMIDGARDALSRSTSDLDIAVMPARSLRLDVRAKAALGAALEDLFGALRVDLVVLPEADPFLAANIIRGERLYAFDAYEADEYDLYVLRRAGDLAPLERERLDLLEGK